MNSVKLPILLNKFWKKILSPFMNFYGDFGFQLNFSQFDLISKLLSSLSGVWSSMKITLFFYFFVTQKAHFPYDNPSIVYFYF